jgi:PhnB protein
MQINPYLNFNGTCDAAFNFYAQALGGKVVYKMTYGESPMAKDMPPELQSQLIHVRLVVGANVLMGSDCPPGRYEEAKGITISISVDTVEEAERVFAALSEKATIFMPIQETFWALRFGMLTDQFGIPWMINCEKPN